MNAIFNIVQHLTKTELNEIIKKKDSKLITNTIVALFNVKKKKTKTKIQENL